MDEAFFDYTQCVRDVLLERYPYLAKPPSDAPDGLDTPLPPPPPICWDSLGFLIPINPPTSESPNEPGPAREEPVLDDEKIITWHDVALAIAAELMQKIRVEVHTKLGYSTSAVSEVFCEMVSRLVG